MERNAEVEAAVDTSILARETDNEKLADIFETLGLAFENIGYEKDSKGCFYQTYKGIFRKREYDKIKIDENIDEEERLRFGLSIKEETRDRFIKKLEKSKIRL